MRFKIDCLHKNLLICKIILTKIATHISSSIIAKNIYPEDPVNSLSLYLPRNTPDYNLALRRHVNLQIEQERYHTALKLLATLSHYINNIITPIMISSDLCKTARTTEHIDELVNYSYNGAKQVAKVIASLREVLGEPGTGETKFLGLEGMIYDLEQKLIKLK